MLFFSCVLALSVRDRDSRDTERPLSSSQGLWRSNGTVSLRLWERERKRRPATCAVVLQYSRAVDMSPLVELRLRAYRWVNPSVGQRGRCCRERKFSFGQSETQTLGSMLSIKEHTDLPVTLQPPCVCVLGNKFWSFNYALSSVQPHLHIRFPGWLENFHFCECERSVGIYLEQILHRHNAVLRSPWRLWFFFFFTYLHTKKNPPQATQLLTSILWVSLTC